MVLVPVVVGSAALVLLGTVWQRVTVRFDWACRAVVLEWHRWPFRSSSRSLPLEEVAGAEVEEKTSTDDGRVFHAVLTLTSGERVPLVDGSTHRAHHEHAAERIRAELARKEMSLHGAAGAPRAGPVGSVDRPPVSD
jgi:hypothetical protein